MSVEITGPVRVIPGEDGRLPEIGGIFASPVGRKTWDGLKWVEIVGPTDVSLSRAAAQRAVLQRAASGFGESLEFLPTELEDEGPMLCGEDLSESAA